MPIFLSFLALSILSIYSILIEAAAIVVSDYLIFLLPILIFFQALLSPAFFLFSFVKASITFILLTLLSPTQASFHLAIFSFS
jgi:hypothetical protein